MFNQRMPEKNAIAMHLSKGEDLGDGFSIFSGFQKVLLEARYMTGRDEFGNKVDKSKFGSWLGAIGYMSLLDQIGTCFKPKSSPQKKFSNTIESALGYFSSLSEKEAQAIYALRCSFTHDFSLYNVNKKYDYYTHSFKIITGQSNVIITFPTSLWDGEFETKNSHQTVVNLELFGDEVEFICTKLFSLANQDDLEILLEGGVNELLDRYHFYQKNNI